MNTSLKFIIATGLMVITSVSYAKEGFYLGANYGQATYDAKARDFNEFNDGSLSSLRVDDSDTSLSLTVGYQITPSISLEGGFIDLGELSYGADSNGAGFFFAPGDVGLDVEVEGKFFAIKGQIPVNESISVYGKLGILSWDLDISLFDSTGSLNGSDDGSDSFYGVGVSFNVTEAVSLNIDYSAFDLDDYGDIDNLSVGVLFRF